MSHTDKYHTYSEQAVTVSPILMNKFGNVFSRKFVVSARDILHTASINRSINDLVCHKTYYMWHCYAHCTDRNQAEKHLR